MDHTAEAIDMQEYEGYRLYADGRIETLWELEEPVHRRLITARGGGWRTCKPILFRGHDVICLWNADRGRCDVQFVDRLIAAAFCGGERDYSDPQHRNGNPRDNHSDNLLWGTLGPDESRPTLPTGDCPDRNATIRELREGGASLEAIGHVFGLSPRRVYRILAD